MVTPLSTYEPRIVIRVQERTFHIQFETVYPITEPIIKSGRTLIDGDRASLRPRRAGGVRFSANGSESKLIRDFAGSELPLPKDIECRRIALRGAGRSCAFIAPDAFQAVSVNWPDQLIPTSSPDAISTCVGVLRALYLYTCAHLHTYHCSVSIAPGTSYSPVLVPPPLSVRGNKRTPFCPRKTKNLFHTRWRFLAFSAAPATPDTVVVLPCLRGTGIGRNNENTNYGSTERRSSRRDNLTSRPAGGRGGLLKAFLSLRFPVSMELRISLIQLESTLAY